MMRTSQAIFVLLASALTLALTNLGCSQSTLSGGSSLTGSKGKDKDKDEGSDDPKETDPDGGQEEEEGTDVPVWVNASYLTCVPETDKSDDALVAILCGLDDETGKAIKPDGTQVSWGAETATGDATDDHSESADTADRYQGRFYFPGKVLAKRAVTVRFNGKGIEKGKKLAMADAITGLEEDGELATCLESEESNAKDCVAASAGGAEGNTTLEPLTKVRMFVMKSLNTGMLGGFNGADAKCQTAAFNASLTGKFKALLSGEKRDAVDLIASGIPIVEAYDGKVIANSRDELFDSLSGSLVKDETGATVAGAAVWTGSTPKGENSGEHCDNWTTNSTNARGTVGKVGETNEDWIHLSESLGACVAPAHLYCVEYK